MATEATEAPDAEASKPVDATNAVDADEAEETAVTDAALEAIAAPEASQANEAASGHSPAEAAGTAPTPAQCAAKLAEAFPALFAAPEGPRPIKLRIQADIQQRLPGLFNRRLLSVVLGRHTTTTAYLKALVQGSQRLDLDGQPAGEISDEHRNAAREELDRRRQIVQARRRPPRGAPRDQQTPPADSARRQGAEAAPGSQAPNARPPSNRHSGSREGGQEQSPERERRGPRPGTSRSEPGPRGGQPRTPHDARQRRDRARPENPPTQGAGPRRAGPHQGHGSAGKPLRTPSRDARGAQPADVLPDDPERRQRALLLRAWESSPLSKANFCTLKRLSEAQLDAELAQARTERTSRHARPPQAQGAVGTPEPGAS
jgi:sRNA-binding protein